MFTDRKDAARKLITLLYEKGVDFDVVMAVPRGGVAVAEEIAAHFKKPMDIVMVKKLDSPNSFDEAIGAVTPDGEVILHQYLDENLSDIDKESVNRLAVQVMKDINLRLNIFRSYRPPVDIRGKKILLVDDGIASGFTMKAAVNFLRRMNAKEVAIAVPVCSRNAYLVLKEEGAEVVCMEIPSNFYAVGQFYEDYTPVDDQDVITALEKQEASTSQT